MTTEPLERKLAAILSADAVDYSRLMAEDDEGTVRQIQDHRRRIARIVDTFRGRVVDATGDNFLAEFPSAVGAVRCALEFQSLIAADNAKLPEAKRMRFRVGIHLGDVLVDDSRLYGDGVNIAARLEPLSAAGGICISDLVLQQVRRRLDVPVADLGPLDLKNIDFPVQAYRIDLDERGCVAAAPRVASTSTLSPPPGASLAVLPFMNTSDDTTQEHFNDGLTLNIMTQLSTLPQLSLIGADSMFTYKSTGATARDVARELGVRHVLQGSVRKSGNRIRVVTQLVEGATGRHVWAEQYDREVKDLFDVEDDIAYQVVANLDAALISGECAITLRKHLRNPKAIGLLYKGVELMRRFTKEDVAEARELFEEVIRLEPESPFGYVEAAWTLYFDVERGWSTDSLLVLERMTELATRAIELGDVSGYSYLMLGHVQLMKRDHDRALELSEKALTERPTCQGAFSLRANILNYCSMPMEAIPLARQAIRLSPVSEPWFPEVLSTSYYLSERYEDAIAACNQALTLAPDSINARLILAATYFLTGRNSLAKEIAAEVLSLDPAFTLSRFTDSQPYREPEVLNRLVSALESSGLPSPALSRSVTEFARPFSASRRRVRPRPRR